MLVLNWNIIWTFVNLIVLFLLLKKFLFKPVTQMIENRQKQIQDSLKEAEDRKNEAEDLKNQYERALVNAKNEAAEIINNAKDKANLEYNSILKDANENASRVMKEAEKTIENQKQKSLEDAKAQIASLAILAAGKVIEKNIDNEQNNKIIDDFIAEAGVSK